jgi:tetratricopeptide (TPR) repeat protein
MKPKTPILLPFIVLFLLFFSLVGCSKQAEISTDHTDNVVKNGVLNKVDSLMKSNLSESLDYTHRLLNSDTIKSNQVLYYNLIEKMAVMKIYTGEIDSSLYFFTRASEFWKNDTSKDGIKQYGMILCKIASCYSDKGEFEKAITIFGAADSLAMAVDNKTLAIHIQILLSNIYQSTGEYGEALECLEKGIKLCHVSGDSVLMISSMQAYADLYTSCFFFDEAKVQFENVLNYKEHFTAYSKFCYFNGKGRMFYLEENYDHAKSEFLKAFELTRKDDVYSNMVILSNLSETYLLLNELDSAKNYLDLLDQYKVGINSFPIFKYNYYSLLGEYYCKSDQFQLANNAFVISDSIGNKIDVDKVLLKLHKKRKARFYSAINNYRDAYLQIKEYNDLNESILKENSRKQVAGLKYKFQRDTTIINQRNNIIINQQQIKNYKYQQWLYIISIVVLLLLVGLLILYFRKVRALNYEKNIRRIAALKMESIRGRISPHFAFNVLNNIWAISDDKENAKAQFDNLMKMIRHSLVNTEKMSIPLGDEIEFVKSYIDLQNLRMNNDLDVEWNIEPVVNLQQPVPGMILQIPVENAIKHGLLPKLGEKKLRIDIGVSSGFLSMVITDNGVGYHPDSITTHGTGTGLKVLTHTLHLLNQVNTVKMTYEIINRSIEGKEGTRVIIIIPNNFNYNLS